ncbi:MAG: N-(5'-phosphoribosyl)anthranilate isomerase [Syntrophaceae bacterium PtaB.Bin038]|nr:MAG: N-(5'-phosphoribosyl)anthranilate isomerase [Syntrophaceae bacterium PtaB.Bin038]
MQPEASAPEGIVQIAGVRSLDEARMLLRAGADWLGFPLRLEHHDEDLPDVEVSSVIAALGIGERAVLITYLERAPEIADLAARTGCRRVQLHGDIAAADVRRLRECAEGLFLIKALVVRPGNLGALLKDAREFGPWVDAFITDSWDPQTGARGATGRTHDWEASRRIVEEAPRPVILAGGLTPGNVGCAIRRVRPAGVDAHTGVEAPDGRKDPTLVGAFVGEARRAFALSKGVCSGR